MGIGYNISEHHSQKLLVGKITILTDLHTDVTYLAYHSFWSSSLAPMVNADGSFVCNPIGRFYFNLLDSNFNDDMRIVGQTSNQKIAYYHEYLTGVIYLLHKEFRTSSITPLAKSDGTYFTYSEWNEIHSFNPPSPELRKLIKRSINNK